MPYNPRAPLMAPVQQFPQQPLQPDPLSAQMMMRRFGGAPQGLLDTMNAPAGLLGPSTVRPGAGLLYHPVIWDRIMRGVSPMPGTEGGGRGMEGGGGRGYQPSLALEGGSGTAPPGYRASGAEPAEPKFKLDWQSFGREGMTHRAVTKNGVRVVISKDRYDPGTVDVMFDAPEGVARGSTKRGINRFEEAYSAVKDYVQGFNPDRLRFTGLTEGHDKIYNRVAPKMAEDLGGRLTMPRSEGGNFVIDLPGSSRGE